MNNTNIKLHEYQVLIIKNLATRPAMRFNDLIIEGLESEHMNYHLQKLLSLNFVLKDANKYSLTDLGKDYSNLLDDNIEIVEKQPKTSVLLEVKRINPKTKEVEHLVCRRLRQPYFGKVGKLTGKVKFGETLSQAAERELYEETGLKAGSVKLQSVYNKIRHNKSNEVVQDVIFYVFLLKDLTGNLIEKTPYQENFWLTKKDIKERTDLDFYDDFNVNDTMEDRELKFSESITFSEGF